MEFFRRAERRPRSLGVLPGTYNPPTRAHLALAAAALEQVDEVLFVMPRLLPHKGYEGVTLADRLRMLELATAGGSRYSLASTDRGLFIDIARECRSAYAPGVRIRLVCGRDAAERALNWDYGRDGAFTEQLNEFEMLVAARRGVCVVPKGLGEFIRHLEMPGEWDEVSATDVRERITDGAPWEHLVPAQIVTLVRELYRG